jgi:hypothetical protein
MLVYVLVQLIPEIGMQETKQLCESKYIVIVFRLVLVTVILTLILLCCCCLRQLFFNSNVLVSYLKSLNKI